jgi:uncharacterized membrane protein YidH (DUF202 family)
MDKPDFLWGMYQEHCTQGRHHEVQRGTVSSFIIIVAGGVLAFMANREVPRGKWSLAVFLIIVGLFGALFSAKQYERFSRHMGIASKYRRELEELLGNKVASIGSGLKSEHEKTFPRLAKLHLHYFWIALHLLIASLGITLLILALRK